MEKLKFLVIFESQVWKWKEKRNEFRL